MDLLVHVQSSYTPCSPFSSHICDDLGDRRDVLLQEIASLHTNSFTHKHFYTETLLHTEAFTHRHYYTQTLLHTDAFTHRRFYTHGNFTSVFGAPTSFRATGTCERVARDKLKSQFYLSFCRSNLISCERNRNFTSVFDNRTSFRAKKSTGNTKSQFYFSF